MPRWDAIESSARTALPWLGSGWQYNAYDLGNGRVLKVPLSREGRLQIALATHRKERAYTGERAARWADGIEKGTQRSYRCLEAALPHLDSRLVGNPVLFGQSIYERDKLLMIVDYLEHYPFEENAAIIDRYIESILDLWESGISDVVFNFAVNSGITSDGRVALCDLGELSIDQERVQRLVQDRVWLRRWSYRALSDIRLKAYVQETLATRLTPERVASTWAILRQDR
jgi:hypothetical protein